MEIYLARHGQSRWQVTREAGDWNSPLTDLGQTQAERLGQWAGSEEGIAFTHIRASTMLRAQQTAAPIGEALQRPVVLDENLREADFLVSAYLPSYSDPFQSTPHIETSPPYLSFKEQVETGWSALVNDALDSDGPVLGVAHGGFISTLLRHVIGTDAISFWIYNATLHHLEWKRGRWHLVNLNQWDHLPTNLRTF